MNYKLDEIELDRLSEIYKLFGSVPRLKILMKLACGECVVSELSFFAEISQSATSHHLKELKHCRIVKSRKEGLNVYYSIDDNHITKMLISGIEHVKGENCNES